MIFSQYFSLLQKKVEKVSIEENILNSGTTSE